MGNAAKVCIIVESNQFHKNYTCSLIHVLDVLHDNQSVNKVVLKIKSLCLSVNPAGWQRGLAHHMPNPPLTPCKYHKMSTGLLACMHMCAWVCTRVCLKLSIHCLSIQTSFCSLIYYLSFVFLSVFSFRSLLFITAWIPKCKMAAERETENVAYIFNGGFLYFNEPSFSLP